MDIRPILTVRKKQVYVLLQVFMPEFVLCNLHKDLIKRKDNQKGQAGHTHFTFVIQWDVQWYMILMLIVRTMGFSYLLEKQMFCFVTSKFHVDMTITEGVMVVKVPSRSTSTTRLFSSRVSDKFENRLVLAVY